MHGASGSARCTLERGVVRRCSVVVMHGPPQTGAPARRGCGHATEGPGRKRTHRRARGEVCAYGALCGAMPSPAVPWSCHDGLRGPRANWRRSRTRPVHQCASRCSQATLVPSDGALCHTVSHPRHRRPRRQTQAGHPAWCRRRLRGRGGPARPQGAPRGSKKGVVRGAFPCAPRPRVAPRGLRRPLGSVHEDSKKTVVQPRAGARTRPALRPVLYRGRDYASKKAVPGPGAPRAGRSKKRRVQGARGARAGPALRQGL